MARRGPWTFGACGWGALALGDVDVFSARALKEADVVAMDGLRHRGTRNIFDKCISDCTQGVLHVEVNLVFF